MGTLQGEETVIFFFASIFSGVNSEKEFIYSTSSRDEGSKQEVTKVVFLFRNGKEKHKSVLIHLKHVMVVFKK